jgi:hypothetical protein
MWSLPSKCISLSLLIVAFEHTSLSLSSPLSESLSLLLQSWENPEARYRAPLPGAAMTHDEVIASSDLTKLLNEEVSRRARKPASPRPPGPVTADAPGGRRGGLQRWRCARRQRCHLRHAPAPPCALLTPILLLLLLLLPLLLLLLLLLLPLLLLLLLLLLLILILILILILLLLPPPPPPRA